MIRIFIAWIALAAASPTLAAPPPASTLQAEMQRLEWARNAAIKSGDMAALELIYAPDFHGIAANGNRVDRPALLAIFRRNAGGDFVAESQILNARRIGALVTVEGRLRLYAGGDKRLISDSLYLHLFRRRSGRWQMVAGSATPVAPPR